MAESLMADGHGHPICTDAYCLERATAKTATAIPIATSTSRGRGQRARMSAELDQVRAALKSAGIDLDRAAEYEPEAIAVEAFRAGADDMLRRALEETGDMRPVCETERERHLIDATYHRIIALARDEGNAMLDRAGITDDPADAVSLVTISARFHSVTLSDGTVLQPGESIQVTQERYHELTRIPTPARSVCGIRYIDERDGAEHRCALAPQHDGRHA